MLVNVFKKEIENISSPGKWVKMEAVKKISYFQYLLTTDHN